MKILCASDKFKGSLSAAKACRFMAEALTGLYPQAEIIQLPVADGGNGTAEILTAACSGREVKCRVHDPLFRIIESSFGMSQPNKTAFIEMAAASGLELLQPGERNCYHTTSYGTGELIREAIRQGAEEIILCLGGSATNDGGIGMAAALGYRFLDRDQNELFPAGKNLEQVCIIDKTSILAAPGQVSIKVASDVTNPLTGLQGAALVYGPQKGASMYELERMDAGLVNLAGIIRDQMGTDIENIPGAGAAGGMGGGAIAFLHATIESGIDLVLDRIGFEESICDCNLLITGEGKIDLQTLQGKAIHGIITRARRYGVPVIALAGKVELTQQQIRESGLAFVTGINPPGISIDNAMKHAGSHIFNTVKGLGPVIEKLAAGRNI